MLGISMRLGTPGLRPAPGLSLGAGGGSRILDLTALPLPPQVSFSRPSGAVAQTATGALARLGSDQPRLLRDPVTSAPRGLLVEPQATNLCPQNTDLRSGWTKSAPTQIDPDLHLGLDGHLSATHITLSGGSAFVYQVLPVSGGTAYMFSFYVKSLTTTEQRMAVYDHTNGSWIVPSTVVTQANSTALADGWRRAVCAFTTPPGCTEIRLYPARSAGPATLGAALVMGVQLETGLEASSLILTDTGPGTRAADQPSLSGLSGVFDITLTYADDTTHVIPGATIQPGDWPAGASDQDLARIVLTPIP